MGKLNLLIHILYYLLLRNRNPISGFETFNFNYNLKLRNLFYILGKQRISFELQFIFIFIKLFGFLMKFIKIANKILFKK